MLTSTFPQGFAYDNFAYKIGMIATDNFGGTFEFKISNNLIMRPNEDTLESVFIKFSKIFHEANLQEMCRIIMIIASFLNHQNLRDKAIYSNFNFMQIFLV